jgi:LPXTG-site transpeptidase (sortase) family protein
LYYPLSRALVRFRINQNKTTTNEKVIAIPTGNPQLNKEYSLTVPKIMAYAKIIPNVSPYNRDEYIKVLSDNVVAQIKGSADPGSGKGKSIYIFAHSTQQGFRMVVKNAVFYLLGELKNGDFIYVNKYGKVYTYEVYKQQIVKADEIKYLTYTEPDKEILILQTCWPIGTDWNRLLIFSQLVR